MTTVYRDQRLKAGLTQAQLAKKLRVTIGTIYNWESGRHTPSHLHQQEIKRLANGRPKRVRSTA
ncbi:MAG: helix-turn-helix transcriptional regulator [Planctomycetota bacterium]